jgi:hypothetical protein
MWNRLRFTLRLRQCSSSDTAGRLTGPIRTIRIARTITTIIGIMTGMITGTVTTIGIIIGGKLM